MKSAAKDGFMQTAQASAPGGQDAFDILLADHRRLRALFEAYRRLAKSADDGAKRAIVVDVCNELITLATVEEEIFYPAARAVGGDAGPLAQLLNQAEAEHRDAKALIAQLRAMQAGDSHCDALVAQLDETISRHVKQEEGELFPLARLADLDTTSLGAKILELKGELQARQLPDQQPDQQPGALPEADAPQPELARRQFGNA
jgi:hypothetical protein